MLEQISRSVKWKVTGLLHLGGEQSITLYLLSHVGDLFVDLAAGIFNLFLACEEHQRYLQEARTGGSAQLF